jgi:hypothetical protein
VTDDGSHAGRCDAYVACFSAGTHGAGGTIDLDLALFVDFVSGSGTGTFSTSGILEDSGRASYSFRTVEGAHNGLLTLAGSTSILGLRSTCRVTFTSALAADVEGSCIVASCDGLTSGLEGCSGRLKGRLTYCQSRRGFVLPITGHVSVIGVTDLSEVFAERDQER